MRSRTGLPAIRRCWVSSTELNETGTDVYGPYPKSLSDGRRLSSVSAVIRDADGKPDAVLCINVDRTAFEEASRILAAFAAPVTGQPRVLFEHDWSEALNDLVGGFVRERGVAVERLTKQDRLELLGRLDAAGVLSQRRSVPAVARALRISRSALYQLLAQARRSRSMPTLPDFRLETYFSRGSSARATT